MCHVASEQVSKAALEEKINDLRTELAISNSQLSEMEHIRRQKDKILHQLDEHQSTIADLEKTVNAYRREKSENETALRKAQQRAQTLQSALDTSEHVQRDFVRLSQSLQIQLEKIRQGEHEVRWQDEDDVIACNSCTQLFTRQRRKYHCRHCGKIFCDQCLSRVVPSGPQKKLARVCEVCHTLLVRDSAPFFAVQMPKDTHND
ncbi:unnamed protein product [Soboliphyme baturini]|uniref:FYVE-type domain-containing protein n=1 Tax=Soboliphyme baturini TaxID=241478 RepID=A0A183J389_9BILA|nr:unnamed protein product [Soboliphyme baturini]